MGRDVSYSQKDLCYHIDTTIHALISGSFSPRGLRQVTRYEKTMHMNINFRPILPSDESFLWEMLYQALYVPPGKPPFPRAILREPDIACYVQGWGRSGDWGLLACDGETHLGAIWLRQWSGDEKGYGYVSPAIPELSIAILPEYRNKGLGTRMLKTVISMAEERFPGLSLSVMESSPARQLYERLGFKKVGQILDSLVMLLDWKGN
jgi:ribosomal protein S18 acetylase RimI-like enzyme